MLVQFTLMLIPLSLCHSKFLALSDDLDSLIGKNCEGNLQAFNVTSFYVRPWPLVRKFHFEATMKGIMTTPETLSELIVNLYYNGTEAYLEKVPESGTYSAGQNASVIFKGTLPSISPSGLYNVQFKLRNEDGDFLNCWEVDFTLY